MSDDMFSPEAILIKTDKGTAALQDRTSLQTKLRLLLIMVDGTASVKALLSKAAAIGATAAGLTELFELELITVHSAGAEMDSPATPVAAPPAAVPSLPKSAAEPDTRALAEAKSLLRYCVRNCAGMTEARELNAALDDAHGREAIMQSVTLICKRLSGPMVERTRVRVQELLG